MTEYKKKLDAWVPQEWMKNNVVNRISICESLLNRKAAQTGAKSGLTIRKIRRELFTMCCSHMDKLLIRVYTVNSLKEAIAQKQPVSSMKCKKLCSIRPHATSMHSDSRNASIAWLRGSHISILKFGPAKNWLLLVLVYGELFS